MTELEKKMISKIAKKIVDRIVEDICDRDGLQNEWESIDSLTQSGIKKTWADIIISEM